MRILRHLLVSSYTRFDVYTDAPRVRLHTLFFFRFSFPFLTHLLQHSCSCLQFTLTYQSQSLPWSHIFIPEASKPATMDSHKTTTPTTAECPRKPMKRRSNTRRVSKDSAINMAEARREIVHALHLHRSSASATRRENTILGNNYNVNKPNFIVGSPFYCCSLINTLPTPEPIWSTTAPSILAAPAPAEELEFEWGENESSSWSWWFGFLKTLDKNSDRSCVEEESNADNIFMGKSGEMTFVEQSDDQGSFPDEWLVIPTNYDEDEEAVP
ncbi:hypothetical protein HS088_TW03G01101 [Tripterygium wilfordii]|uniref:Uncharacterized protein n=1 Tax=Tripterygium wilfordii TaxID=458696 RepID=A0A7J7DWL5_TRIWF|nr:hypothetical protein HS088_TW03G01101 [Tripterygium wilfordii]